MYRKEGPKHVYVSDLEAFWRRGQSPVVYHHLGRNGKAPALASKTATLLQGEREPPTQAERGNYGMKRLYGFLESRDWQAWRVSFPMVKVTVAVMGLALAIRLQFGSDPTLSEYSYGVKAALLAFGGATSLFFELIPNGNTPYFSRLAPWLPRITGAALAFFAAWNWILDETGGEPFPLIWPVVAMGIFAVLMPTAALFFTAFHLWAMGDGQSESRR